MENNGSPLKIILEKAAFFSDEIDKLHRQVQDVHKEKNMLAKQEESLNNDILLTAKAMHKFLHETISKMTGLYTMIQFELENEKSIQANKIQQKKKPQKNRKNHRPTTKKELIKNEEPKKDVGLKVYETQKKEPQKNKKNLHSKTQKEVKNPNRNLEKKEKEVFLFDL